MGIPRQSSHPMTAEEFFAFTKAQPDDGKWELIEGEPILNPSASYLHQLIVRNLVIILGRMETELAAAWIAIPGIGVELSKTNVPVPDVLVRPRDELRSWKCDDMIVAFEVSSPSSEDHDLHWKRKAYAGLASLQHYVVVAQDTVEVLVYDRANGFAERRLADYEAPLDLPAIGVSLPLAQIYLDTGLKSA